MRVVFTGVDIVYSDLASGVWDTSLLITSEVGAHTSTQLLWDHAKLTFSFVLPFLFCSSSFFGLDRRDYPAFSFYTFVPIPWKDETNYYVEDWRSGHSTRISQ